jgi:GNAT superfamily N-acetyltransferase
MMLERRRAMALELIRARPEMAGELGRIFFTAFDTLFKKHQVPGDLANVEVAVGALQMFTSRPDIYGVAAVLDGRLIGSNFVSLTDTVGGVGPITVDPAVQSRGVGRALMQNVIDHSRKTLGPRVRLVQDAVNTTSISLYSSLGFDVMEPLFLVDQKPAETPDPTVRPATAEDLPAASELCTKLYKVSRLNELKLALAHGAAMGMIPHVRERHGQLTALVIPGFFGFGVADTNEDLLATVTTAIRGGGPFTLRWLVPARNTSLYRMVMKSGGRLARLCNLMATGPYDSPVGAWFPSIAY